MGRPGLASTFYPLGCVCGSEPGQVPFSWPHLYLLGAPGCTHSVDTTASPPIPPLLSPLLTLGIWGAEPALGDSGLGLGRTEAQTVPGPCPVSEALSPLPTPTPTATGHFLSPWLMTHRPPCAHLLVLCRGCWAPRAHGQAVSRASALANWGHRLCDSVRWRL